MAELDDTLGAWWRTNLTPLKGQMTLSLNGQVNFAFTMLVAAAAKHTAWSFALVISGNFLYSYLHKDRLVVCKDIGTVSIVTAVTELASPFLALVIIIARAGCNKVTKSSDPAINTVFHLPDTEPTPESENQSHRL